MGVLLLLLLLLSSVSGRLTKGREMKASICTTLLIIVLLNIVETVVLSSFGECMGGLFLLSLLFNGSAELTQDKWMKATMVETRQTINTWTTYSPY